MKRLIWLSILFSFVAHADDPIYVPNLPGYITGTDLGGGHIGLDVNASITPAGLQDVNLTEVGGAAIGLGQTTMSASIPVAISSNQTAIPASQSGTWNINNISGTVSLPTGASTSAKQPALGTAGTASSDVITVQGIASMTPLLVNGSGSTQPISGTVTANQGGTWNITNISGTVSLPTGAATAAKQPALGTAGSASSDVITVQGVASMTALKVDGSAVTQPVSISATSAPIFPNGSLSQSTTIGSSGTTTISKPANTVGVQCEASSSNTVNLRLSIGSAATTTSGLRLEPGRDTGYLPVAHDISVEAESGSNQEIDCQWVLNQ